MLVVIPLADSDSVFLALEGYVRPIESSSPLPISEDPASQPAMIYLQCDRSGEVHTALHPYTVSDDGTLTWSSPGAVSSPAVPMIVDTIKELFGRSFSKDDSTRLLIWLKANGYSAILKEGLIGE